MRESFILYARSLLTVHRRHLASGRRHDTRTRAWRHEQSHRAWQAQMPALVDQYLAWKHLHNDADVAQSSDHVFHVAVVGVFGKFLHF